MSDKNEASNEKHSKYERIPSTELQEMLRYSAYSDDALNLDMVDEVISELDRRGEIPKITTPEEALEKFKAEYSGRESAYLDCAFEEGTQTKKNVRSPRRLKRMQRVAVLVAVITALLVISTATASAFGFDLWGAIATWSRETFSFASETGQPESRSAFADMDESDNALRDALLENGIDVPIAPNWLPDGFELVELLVEDRAFLTIHVRYTDGERSAILNIRKLDNPGLSNYEKDSGDVEEYIHGETAHYITSNDNQTKAVWISGNLECNLSGDFTLEELKGVIKSIYKE